MGSGNSKQKIVHTPKTTLVLYMMDVSAPCRGVMFTAALAGITLEYVRIDLMKGDQMKPEFLKVTYPT